MKVGMRVVQGLTGAKDRRWMYIAYRRLDNLNVVVEFYVDYTRSAAK